MEDWTSLGQPKRKPVFPVDGDLSLPRGLALGRPIFPSGCEGKLGVALESLQGDWEFRIALGLAQGSPIFNSSCEGELGIAHESLQGKRDLI